MEPQTASQNSQIVFGLNQNMGSRANMEDHIEVRFVQTGGGLDLFVALVADGIGGHNCGEVASELTVQTTFAQIAASPARSPSQIPQMLAEALMAANDVVYQESRRDLKKSGMGTTATIAAIHENNLYLANVGDSRAYLMRDQKLTQLSSDHTWAREMVHQGHLSVAEAAAHPKGGALVRSIGYEQQVAVDVGLYINGDEPEQQAQQHQGLPLAAGDIILLCSDGLIKERRNQPGNFVEDEELLRLATKHSPDKAAAALVKKAVSRQADDNVSAIVVAIAPGKQKTAVPWKLFGGVAALLLLLVVAYFTYATLAGGRTAAVSTAPAPTAAAVVVELETAVPPTPVPTNPPANQETTTVTIRQNKGNLYLGDGSKITTGSVPLAVGQVIENKNGVSELGLADGAAIFLDEGTAVKLLALAGLDGAAPTVIEPQSGSLLLVEAASPLRFQVPGSRAEYAQTGASSLAIVGYSETPFFFSLACLAGTCEIDMFGVKKQLTPGESICVGGGCKNSGTVEPIAYERYTYLARLVPTPTLTPTPTQTPTLTPSPTWTPSPTPTNTPTPTTTATAAPIFDNGDDGGGTPPAPPDG